ncbi:MAG: hypothetical protein IJJ26_12240, partial [Victivallales bacterium]|nr:hypothetical protein [Victivallales bacterium]
MKSRMMIWTMLISCIWLYGFTFMPGVEIRKEGMLRFDEGRLEAALSYYNPEWIGTEQAHTVNLREKRGETSFELSGTMGDYLLKESVTSTQRDRLHYEASLTAKDGKALSVKEMFLGIKVRKGKEYALSIDGVSVEYEWEKLRRTIFKKNANKVTFTTPNARLEFTGEMYVTVIGAFPYNTPWCQIRIFPRTQYPQDNNENNRSRLIQDWKLALDVAIDVAAKKVQSVPIDLTKAFNRSTIDGGRIGGWTGQGREMDLRSLPSGPHDFHSVKMQVADPKGGDAKNCIAIGGTFDEKAETDVECPDWAGYIYLLQASAWTPNLQLPIGHLDVTYADGKQETITVHAGTDCGNWYKPFGWENSYVAWKSQVPTAPIGLYLSAFPIHGKAKRLVFRRSENKSRWFVVAASFSDRRAAFPQDTETYVVKNGPEWLPVSAITKIAAGSPLDFSGFPFRDAPAGKYGHIRADKDGHLFYENLPGKRVRLHGVNLVGNANYVDPETQDFFIECAERIGYNTVRMHHFENTAILRKGVDNSTTPDEKALDTLFQFIAKLKQHGFYICIDLYASRHLKAGDGIAEFDNSGEFSMKNLVCVSPTAMENWKKFAKMILLRKNKYTGMTLAEDPVLYKLNLVNENPLPSTWASIRTSKAARDIIDKRFEEYLAKSPVKPDGKTITRNGLFIQFLVELQEPSIREMMDFLKKEVGYKGLIADLNMTATYSLIGLRSMLDFVNNNEYWDHPKFPMKRWQYPFVFHNNSSIADGASQPLFIGCSRFFGKPFAITEYCYVLPNVWRVEAPGLVGGYASLQDWDGLYRFAWSHGDTRIRKNCNEKLRWFDGANDVQAQMADRITALLFLRGDVRPAKEAYAFEYNPQDTLAVEGSPTAGTYPDAFRHIGLRARIGSTTKEAPCDAVRLNPFQKNWSKKLSLPTRAALADFKS